MKSNENNTLGSVVYCNHLYSCRQLQMIVKTNVYTQNRNLSSIYKYIDINIYIYIRVYINIHLHNGAISISLQILKEMLSNRIQLILVPILLMNYASITRESKINRIFKSEAKQIDICLALVKS